MTKCDGLPPTAHVPHGATHSGAEWGLFGQARLSEPRRPALPSAYNSTSLLMISFMISLVPPPMVMRRTSRQARAMGVSVM